nr:reverse transcriptase domain-containing protein [Tanacetum cinerariifolium]
RFKDLLRACPHHGFSELHQLDTFYNALNSKDQDSLNSAGGGNFLDKMPHECLAVIESKSKVRYSRDKPVVVKVSTNASTSGVSPDAELKDMVKALLQKRSKSIYCSRESSRGKLFNYNHGNTSYRPPMMSNQIRPLGFPPVPNNQNVQRNNQNRFISNQNRGNNFNQGPVYQPLVFQPPAYQATQGVSKEDYLAYVKANDAVMRNMQTQGQNINTIANLKSELKAITTQSGVTYDGPQILPSTSFLPKVVEDEPEATKDTVNPTNNRNTKDVQPQAVQSESLILTSKPVTSLISEPAIAPVSASKPNPKASIPYPSRRNDEMNREKANNQIEKFYQIFKDMSFEISFTDALILMPKFASTLKALIGNKEKLSELTLRVGKEAITFNLDQTSRYYANHSDMTAKRIDVIDMACEEYSQEVLGFSDIISSGNPTPYYDLIVSTTSSTLTLFGNSDFLLEEVDAFLDIEDEPTLSEFYQLYLDPERDILLLEAFLNDDPLPPPNQGNYLPEVRKELKICEAKSDKSSVDEPLVVKLKDLPLHLEYAFLEGNDKLPVITAKDLSVEEKAALITVLKSHKQAITWKFFDIKGINLEFCTHKILMEDDFKPVVQHQRRVNPKIHDVIKQEVIKLLEAGLIYPISDSPWVSSMHCVPKKGGFTVVENEDNELIPTRLVTGWRVCIDYHKLNEATRKDHFPLPFMDQMLERLAGNQYYCFLDGFSGYFQIPINPKD